MDEHEALIEYSEMTTFNFNSKEFQEVRKDYEECRNILTSVFEFVKGMMTKKIVAKNY